MAENYSFFNSKNHDRTYNVRHWADYFLPLFKSGVFNGDLQVVADGGMSVRINEGYAWIDGYAYHLTDGLVLDLETASGNMSRIDNIVIRLDLTNRWIRAFCRTGNYAMTPAPSDPEITKTVHEIIIARVSVAAGTTEISQAMIEDTRMNGDICGWVCGTVEEIDFSQITAQFSAFFDRYENDIQTQYELYRQNISAIKEQAKADFDAWFDSVQDVLAKAENGELLEAVRQQYVDRYETDIKPLQDLMGATDITQIGDGTVTGVLAAQSETIAGHGTAIAAHGTAIDALNTDMAGVLADLAYRDIADDIQFNAGTTGIRLNYTHINRGMVTLVLNLPSNRDGMIEAHIAEKYAPKINAYGIYYCVNTVADAEKVVHAGINSSGRITIWFKSALVNTEGVYFCYPLK